MTSFEWTKSKGRQNDDLYEINNTKTEISNRAKKERWNDDGLMEFENGGCFGPSSALAVSSSPCCYHGNDDRDHKTTDALPAQSIRTPTTTTTTATLSRRVYSHSTFSSLSSIIHSSPQEQQQSTAKSEQSKATNNGTHQRTFLEPRKSFLPLPASNNTAFNNNPRGSRSSFNPPSILSTLLLISAAILSTAILISPVAGQGRLKRTEEIPTNWGKIRGFVVQPPVPDLRPVDVFLGIPYGEPPTGKNRFMLTRTAARWSNTVKDATRVPPSCVQFNTPDTSRRSDALKRMPEMQFDYIRRLMPALNQQSENCLFLNLYVPQRQGPEPRPGLPVLVLVHGESYEWGAGSPYNASILASYGQVIVVTLNYRLGVFGFLSCGETVCHGNWGLSDIVCALQFLRDIIQPFGGDPDAITLAGWGTGASLVNLLMASPMSAPAGSRLFQRAILMSGSSLSPESIVRNPAENFYRLAENLGCPVSLNSGGGSDSDSGGGGPPADLRPPADILACIKGHSVDNITKATNKLERPSFISSFGPVVDGTIISTDPAYNLARHSALYHDIDLLMGMNTFEGFTRLSRDDLEQGIDVSKQDKIYRTMARNLYSYHRREIYSAIKNEYTDWTSPGQHPISVRDSVITALGDCLVTAPAIKAAKLHAKQGPNSKSSTFLYVFNHATKDKEWNRASLNGAVNREDLAYILGYPLLHATSMNDLPFQATFARPERHISEAMMRYVSNFVKSGNPNRPIPIRATAKNNLRTKFENLQWPPFEFAKQAYARIDTNPSGDELFYRADEVAFWNKFLPALQKAGQVLGAANERGGGSGDMADAHNLLPDHFQKNSYFGIVRPYGGYKSYPFPPPPLPPTPMPKEVTTILQAQKDKEAKDTKDKKKNGESPAVAPAGVMEYSTILSVTVAVGCALLVLNILIFAGIYHQRDKQKRSKKQMQLHYQSYDTAAMGAGGGAGGLGAGLNLNSPLTSTGPRMPPPPPPPMSALGSPNPSSAPGVGVGGGGHHHMIGGSNDIQPTLHSAAAANHHQHNNNPSNMRTFHHTHTHGGSGGGGGMNHPGGGGGNGGGPNGGMGNSLMGSRGINQPSVGFQEQEPLLSNASSVGSRSHGISPTCPRHGRALAAAQANAVEEIQV